MLSARSTHKRKRSARRGDDARDQKASGRAILTLGGASGEGNDSSNAMIESSWAWKRLERDLAAHPFNHRLQLLFPLPGNSTIQLQKQQQDILTCMLDRLVRPGTAFLASIPISLFLDPVFAHSYIHNGSLVALSAGRLDVDDVFCLDGHGTLHLSLTRDTYQSLGLEGRKSKMTHTSSGRAGDRRSGGVERWTVRIDLKDQSFKPGKAGYTRTLASLQAWDASRINNLDGLGFGFVSSANSFSKGETSSSSRPSWQVLLYHSAAPLTPDCSDSDEKLGKEHHGCQIMLPARFAAASCTMTPMNLEAFRTTLEDIWLPDLSHCKVRRGWSDQKASEEQIRRRKQRTWEEGEDEWTAWMEEVQDLTAWTTLVACGAECTRTFSRSDYVNGYQLSEPRISAKVVLVEYVGFFSASFVKEVVDAVGRWTSSLATANEGNGELWAHIKCSGFEDAPVAWLTPHPRTQNVASAYEDRSNDADVDRNESGKRVTGKTARRTRSRKLARRSHMTSQSLNDHVRGPEMHAGRNGWELFLFERQPQHSGRSKVEIDSSPTNAPAPVPLADYLYIEDVTSVLRS